MASVRKAFAINAVGSYLRLAVDLVTILVISRLLTPAEIGVFSIALSFIMFANVLRDFGVNVFIVQAKELGAADVNAASTFALLVSWSLGAIVFASAGWAAGFFAEPSLAPVLQIIALNFFLSPFGMLFQGILQREMAFFRITLVAFISAVVNCTLSIGLVLIGFSTLGLAYASVAATAVRSLLFILLKPKGYALGFGLKRLGGVIRIGAPMTGATLLNMVTYAGSELILGRLMNAAAVSYFSRGRSLMRLLEEMLLNVIRPVAMSGFAVETRAGRSIHDQFCKAVSYLTGTVWPAVAFLIIMAEEVVIVLLGEQWMPSVEIARVMSFLQGVVIFLLISRAALEAAGRAQVIFLASAAQVLLFLVFFVLGAQHSLLGAAIGYAAAQSLTTLGVLAITVRMFKIGGRRVIRAAFPSFTLTLLCLAACWGARELAYSGLDFNRLTALLMAGMVGGITWLAGLYLLRHPLVGEISVANDWARVRIRQCAGSD